MRSKRWAVLGLAAPAVAVWVNWPRIRSTTIGQRISAAVHVLRGGGLVWGVSLVAPPPPPVLTFAPGSENVRVQRVHLDGQSPAAPTGLRFDA